MNKLIEKFLKKIKKTEISEPFSDLACKFLDEFSENLKKDLRAKKFSDLLAASFWCRKKNLILKKKLFLDNFNRVSLGVIFHVPPSNIEINFLYSFIFGLLSGNSNIVRISKKKGMRTSILINIIKKLLNKKIYFPIKNNNIFVEYDRDENFTKKISSICDGRIIWGGNQTIEYFKKFYTQPRCRDIMFSDRYSIALLNSDKILNLNKFNMKRLSNDFFNDTYLNDQLACSSPHLILWMGNNINNAKNKFWKSFEIFVKSKYILSDDTSIQKYTHFQSMCSSHNDMIKNYHTHDNYICRLELKNLMKNIEKFKSFGGFFLEFDIKKLSSLKEIINNNYQTLSYFGFFKKNLISEIKLNQLNGIDRIVPVGQTLDIDLIWDGFDIIKQLTRVVEVR